MELTIALIALTLTGLTAGLFYAFSMSVMWGLNAIDPAQAGAAMVSINRKILNPWLFITFMGSPVAALIAGIVAGSPAALWFYLAAGVNFAGSFLVTVAINVPMNNALDQGKMSFAEYSPRWTAFNTLRTIACVASTVLVGIGIAYL
ncbi:DUF1772 domain-containing protein [Nonomuraea typhae]|uniref:anthrone oxygenase family protein n=1 Tax=Nonomuraea typhae TaxID=2603600 RepID=UPI0012FA6FF2|nr:anthrone oxygenase family protein [Nonomuraea typhae]